MPLNGLGLRPAPRPTQSLIRLCSFNTRPRSRTVAEVRRAQIQLMGPAARHRPSSSHGQGPVQYRKPMQPRRHAAKDWVGGSAAEPEPIIYDIQTSSSQRSTSRSVPGYIPAARRDQCLFALHMLQANPMLGRVPLLGLPCLCPLHPVAHLSHLSH